MEKNKFVIDKIYPIAIREFNDNIASIIFNGYQNSTEEYILIQSFINIDDTNRYSIKSNILNINNLIRNKYILQRYVDATKDATSIYNFSIDNIKEVKNKPYFYTSIDNNNLLEILFNRDSYIKIKLLYDYIINNKDTIEELIEDNPRRNNMKFSTVDRIKLDASTEYDDTHIITHYTAGNGPETYGFNFISNKLLDRKLRIPLRKNIYDNSYRYNKDYTVRDIIKEDGYIYIIYEVFSDITEQYKETKVLKITNELCNKTNLLVFDNAIYD